MARIPKAVRIEARQEALLVRMLVHRLLKNYHSAPHPPMPHHQIDPGGSIEPQSLALSCPEIAARAVCFVLHFLQLDPGLVVEFHCSVVSSLCLLYFFHLAAHAGHWADQAGLYSRRAEAVLVVIARQVGSEFRLWRQAFVAAHRDLQDPALGVSVSMNVGVSTRSRVGSLRQALTWLRV